MSANAKRFNVYVIELDKAILELQKFREANPDYDPTKPCVCVGMTARSPEERFQQHLSGYKAARFTKRYGVRGTSPGSTMVLQSQQFDRAR
jgi:hypothetical protein